MRLDKFLAEAAGLTRKDAKAVLGKGRVTVNGEVCKAGDRKLCDSDTVELDGKALSAQEEFLYLMLHKPAGVVSATEDKRDKTVLDVVRECEMLVDCTGDRAGKQHIAGILGNRIDEHYKVTEDTVSVIRITLTD